MTPEHFLRFRPACTALLALALAACASAGWQARQHFMEVRAAEAGWQRLALPADRFVLTAFVPADTTPARTLTVYIEGDGLAWLTPRQPSDNPTPREPVALDLALRHAGSAVAYLSRPCQGVNPEDWGPCGTAYWTSRRYASEVIDASASAIDALMRRRQAERLVLVGFSGGASVAALVASRRKDVAALITVAGNLDTAAWTTHHQVSPLSGSLNPADFVDRLQEIPQRHLVGAADRVVPPRLLQDFAQRFPAARRPEVRIVPGFDHQCCWAQAWPRLYAAEIQTLLSGTLPADPRRPAPAPLPSRTGNAPS